MNEWIPVIVAVLGSGGLTALATLLLVKRQARKISAETELTDANAAEKLTGVALKLVEPLTKQLQTAEARCERLNEQLQAAQGEVQELRGQVEQMSKDLVAKQVELDQLTGS